jgi:hypothetical protein
MSFGRRARATLIVFLGAGLLTFGFTACGDPPDREMQQAQTAIDAARTAGAERYATAELAAAETALKDAKAAVEQRDYRLALNHALDSRERAQNAIQQTATAKAAERQTADRAIGAATAALGTVNRLVKRAEATRTLPKLVASGQSAIALAEPRVQEARTAYERGDYTTASTAATAVVQELQALVDELTKATAPAPRRHR